MYSVQARSNFSVVFSQHSHSLTAKYPLFLISLFSFAAFQKSKLNPIRCNVSLRGNGLKVLTANNFIPSQTPIIECRGKYMLGSGNHRYIPCCVELDPVLIPYFLGLVMHRMSCPIPFARTWRSWWTGKRTATTPDTVGELTPRVERPMQLCDITWTRAVYTCTSLPAGTLTATKRSFCLQLRFVSKRLSRAFSLIIVLP